MEEVDGGPVRSWRLSCPDWGPILSCRIEFETGESKYTWLNTSLPPINGRFVTLVGEGALVCPCAKAVIELACPDSFRTNRPS